MNPIEDSSVLFKQKRDEYLIEIRKKKNTDFIKSKRTKIANLDPNNPANSDQSNEVTPSPFLPPLNPYF